MTDRSIFSVTGSDRATFLQGMVTNDVDKLKDGIVYTALLTPQGKYLADFFLIPADDAILIDIKTEIAAPTLQRLTMYKLRADVQIAESPLKVGRGTGPMPEGAFPDPRHDALGWRHYAETPHSDETDWTALRVTHQIPETGVELTPDTYILEVGFENLNGVDFRKGCYVGQEVTARMKHKTELRKGLAQVAVSGDAATGAQITKDGKAVGTLLSRAGDKALAYLRFDRADGPLEADGATLHRL
ncbi:folate-binding protein [Cognatishimia sp. MH4019]|uniref:CAF17-like 4Fe-4S cluster assembly/insertion protein YgfZ n=1 Tax=Cognatishimia sp. MH4019 TaxID=2854030 RepID=UPI001CD283F5